MGIKIALIVATLIFALWRTAPGPWILFFAVIITTLITEVKNNPSKKQLKEQQTEIEALKKRIEELEKLRNEGH